MSMAALITVQCVSDSEPHSAGIQLVPSTESTDSYSTTTPIVVVPAPTPVQSSLIVSTPVFQATAIPVSTESEPLTAQIVGFKHQNLTVTVGTTVIWINQDPVAHNTTSGTPP